MTADECKPGVRVVTPGGQEAMLLHPNPRKPERWLVYRDGRGDYWDASELRKADNVSDH
jgi:hypothetical protein